MIYTNVTVKIHPNGTATSNTKVLLYRGDREIEIQFTLVGNPFIIEQSAYAQLIITRTQGGPLFTNLSEVKDSKVILTISADHIDELTEVGFYNFQIRLYDSEMNARVTLPPVENGLEVREPIADEVAGRIGRAMVGYSLISRASTPEDQTFIDDEYNRTYWVDGDYITDVRMNKIEDAIYTINEKAMSDSGKAYLSCAMTTEQLVELGASLSITFEFASSNLGRGSLRVYVNSVEKMALYVEQEETTIEIPGEYFTKGDNTVILRVTDRAGVASNNLVFDVRYGGTELASDFDSYTAYAQGSSVRYYFVPTALDTSIGLTFFMEIDDTVQPGVECTPEVRGYYTFPNNLSIGAHRCKAYIIDDNGKRSNTLEFNLVIIDDTSIVVATENKNPEIEAGDQLSLDYKVYSKTENSFIVKVYMDGTLIETGSCGLTTSYYKTSSLREGSYTFKIEAWDQQQNKYGEVTWTVVVNPSTFNRIEPSISGSLFIASAANRSNSDSERDVWVGVDQDGTEIRANLSNFSFNSESGWVDGELVFNGLSSVEIPIAPLANNARYGFTLDLEFTSKAIGVEDALVLKLWDDVKNCGIKITTEEMILRSAEGNEARLYFEDNTNTSVMFIIDRNELKAKIYLNGVMCSGFHLSDYVSEGEYFLEDFSVSSNIKLGGSGSCKIRNLRVYEVALTTNEILNNFIANKVDKQEQQELYDFQYGSELPTLTVYCDFSGLGKDDKKPCSIVYTSTDEIKYGKSFRLDHKESSIQYQGTSSMAYPIKNYRLNLRDENGEKLYYDFPFGKPECRFTLKADFMSSGHWQNTGLTKWINDNLYNYKENDPKSMNPKKWFDLQNGGSLDDTRECIYGFPCRLVLVNDGDTPLNVGQNEPTPGNVKDMGIFNFNNDKDNTTTMGLDGENFPNCMSFEVAANSDTSAGAFMSYKPDVHQMTELEYLQQSFEARYPDKPSHEWYGYLGIYAGTMATDYCVVDGGYSTMYWSWTEGTMNITSDARIKTIECYKNNTLLSSISFNGTYGNVTLIDGTNTVRMIFESKPEHFYINDVKYLFGKEVDNIQKQDPYLGDEMNPNYGLKRLVDWVDKSTDEEFVRDFENYFIKDYTLRYYLLVITLGMVDNLGKNMMLDSWDGLIWAPRFYDCDTICSYDNSGDIKFDVDIEMEQGYWNTSSSRLWTRIRDLMHDDLVAKYNDMRQNGLAYETLMDYFYGEQISKIPQKYYNMDYDVKYAPFADGYMSMAHGDGYEHLKRWLKNRLIFTDSLFDYAPGYNNDMLTIRANTTDLMTINIETYTPVYQHVSWYNGQMDKKKIDGKNSVSFSGYSMTATDQEVLIYGGSNVKRITGISSMNPNQMLIGSATRLTELDASNSPLLEDINANKANLLAHTYLNKVNLSNCSALGGNLRLDNSPLLQEINMSGTAITGINLSSSIQNLKLLKLDGTGVQKLTLRDNSLLTSLDLPATITDLTLKDMRALRTITWNGYSNLQKLSLENVQTDIATIMARADKIEAIRLINIDCQLAIVPMQKIMGLKGLDSNGNDIPIGQAVSGKIKLSSCTQTLENQLKTMFPLVQFTVLSYVSGYSVKFYDGDNKLLYEEEVILGGTATYVGPTPTKSSTAQYTYTFNGWNVPLGPITGNTTIRAEFTATLRYYTIRFLYPSTDELIDSQYLPYGDTPKPPVAGADYEGWTPAITTVTEDADYYAVPLPTPEDMSIFNLTEVTIDGTSGYNCELLAVSYLPANLVFPSKYNGLPVLSISGSKSTTGKTNIKTIVIPSTIKHIGDYTFYGCSQATTLNDGVKPLMESVGERAFSSCSKMSGIWNLDNIKSIGSYAFYNFGNSGNVTEINLGDKCESISDYAFQASKSQKYTWTNGLDVIGSYVFQNANGELHNTKHVKEILSNGCGSYNLSTISDDAWDGLEIIRSSAFTDATAKIFNNRLDVVIPNATLVENAAFSRLGVVRSISLPKVTVVQSQSVYKCSTSGTTTSDDYLNYVSFGSPAHPVTAIESASNASSSYGNFKFTHFITASGTLEGVTINEATRETFETNIKGVCNVFSKKSISRIKDPDNSSIEYAIIDDEYAICLGLPYPLYGTSSYKNVTIPATVNSIPVTKLAGYFWYKGTYLETLTLPDTITALPKYGFQGCSALTSVTGATKIEHIGYYSFYNCTALTTLGNALDVTKSFSSYAIYNCPELKVAINNSAVTGALGSSVIYGTGVTSISFPNVTEIGNYCFYNNKQLTEVNLPKVSSLKGGNNFGFCKALTRINLPSLTTINKPSSSGSSYAIFYNCTALEYATFGSKDHPVTEYAGLAGSDYTHVDMGHFYACDNLKMVNIVTTNGLRSDVAFDSSSQFALEDRCMVFSTEPLNITNTAYVSDGFEYTLTDECAILHSIPEGTTNISVDTISGLPVTNISAKLYADGPNGDTLETINCPNLRHISISMFNGVSALKNVSLPKAEYIGKRAFYECNGMNNITLDFPEVSFVGNSAFYRMISCYINFSSKLKVAENALNNASKIFYVFGGTGDPITNTSGWGNDVFDYFNSSTVADVTIYTTDGTNKGLTGAPWGKSYGVITYLQA